MSDWAEVGWLLGALALSVLVYCIGTYWPQRLPKDRTVQAIRQRIEDEEEDQAE